MFYQLLARLDPNLSLLFVLNDLAFHFKDDDLNEIELIGKPTSTFTKGEIESKESFNLQGFSWQIKKKPHKKSFKR